MRLNKFIASSGEGSRREADKMIEAGRVFVNGERVTALATTVDPLHDRVELDGRVITPEKKKYYIVLNKPKRYITSNRDQRGRASVLELATDIDARLFPVGRLDYNTSGLLILTNDGDFSNAVAHPRNEIYKTYIAKINSVLRKEDIKRLREGIGLDDGMTAPARVDIIKVESGRSEVKISIYEGRNRQVRRMFAAVGCADIELRRIAVGDVMLGHLPEGKWRHMTEHEIKSLYKRGEGN